MGSVLPFLSMRIGNAFHRRILSEQLNLTLSVCIAAVYILHSPPSLLPSLYVIALARIAMTEL